MLVVSDSSICNNCNSTQIILAWLSVLFYIVVMPQRLAQGRNEGERQMSDWNHVWAAMRCNWSVRRISNLFGCNRAVAREYFQPCQQPEQALELYAAYLAIDRNIAA